MQGVSVGIQHGKGGLLGKSVRGDVDLEPMQVEAHVEGVDEGARLAFAIRDSEGDGVIACDIPSHLRVLSVGGSRGTVLEGPREFHSVAQAGVLERSDFGDAASGGPREARRKRGVGAAAVVHHGTRVVVEGGRVDAPRIVSLATGSDQVELDHITAGCAIRPRVHDLDQPTSRARQVVLVQTGQARCEISIGTGVPTGRPTSCIHIPETGVVSAHFDSVPVGGRNRQGHVPRPIAPRGDDVQADVKGGQGAPRGQVHGGHLRTAQCSGPVDLQGVLTDKAKRNKQSEEEEQTLHGVEKDKSLPKVRNLSRVRCSSDRQIRSFRPVPSQSGAGHGLGKGRPPRGESDHSFRGCGEAGKLGRWIARTMGQEEAAFVTRSNASSPHSEKVHIVDCSIRRQAGGTSAVRVSRPPSGWSKAKRRA